MPTFSLPIDTGINFSEGVQQLFVYTAGQVPILIPSILTAFFLIIWMTGSTLQRKNEGRSVYPQWFAIAGYATTVLAVTMMLIEGLIPLYVVGTTLAVTILGTVWFFTSKD